MSPSRQAGGRADRQHRKLLDGVRDGHAPKIGDEHGGRNNNQWVNNVLPSAIRFSQRLARDEV